MITRLSLGSELFVVVMVELARPPSANRGVFSPSEKVGPESGHARHLFPGGAPASVGTWASSFGAG